MYNNGIIKDGKFHKHLMHNKRQQKAAAYYNKLATTH